MTTSTTATTTPERALPRWLKGSVLAALLVGVCWAGAIFYWRAASHLPTPIDMLLYLLALPVALIMALGFARNRVAAPNAPVPAAASSQPSTASAAPPPLAMIASALRLPHGESAQELSLAITDNKARADLDPELVDDDGFPVMTMRSPGDVDPVLQEQITRWWTSNGINRPALTDAQWRALTMASEVIGDLASVAAGELIPAEGKPPLIQLFPVLPIDWGLDLRRAAGMWFRHTVAQFGWPLASIMLHDGQQEAAPAILNRLGREATAGAPVVAMLLACDSAISEHTVAQWERERRLFTASRPDGQVPGEGAAGLLLVDLHQAGALPDVLHALLYPVAEARRAMSIDEARRTDLKPLLEAANCALESGATRQADVAMLVADTGHRSNRVLELMEFASNALPHMDSVADVARVGAACGSCGAVPFITALALARHHALDRAGPVLCVSNDDPLALCAVLVKPYASA